MIDLLYKAALHIAIEEENIEIIKLLLESGQINVNLTCIYLKYFSCNLKSKSLIIFCSYYILIAFIYRFYIYYL